MNRFIKLLVISFPFVLTGALFWPVFMDKSVPETNITARDPLLTPSPIIDNYKANITKQKPYSKTNSSPQLEQSNATIYRWVDENGLVSFSDRPLSKGAVVHEPKPLGNISVSGDIKQRLARQEYQNAQLKADLLANSIQKSSKKTNSSTTESGYHFSNTSAGQKHGYVLLSGRISGGSACRALLVRATASSDKGRRVKGIDTVKFSGFGSTLYEIKVHSYWQGGKQRRPQWEPLSVSAFCQDN